MEVDVHGKFFITNIFHDSEMGGLGAEEFWVELVYFWNFVTEITIVKYNYFSSNMVQVIRSYFILEPVNSFRGWIVGLPNSMIWYDFYCSKM